MEGTVESTQVNEATAWELAIMEAAHREYVTASDKAIEDCGARIAELHNTMAQRGVDYRNLNNRFEEFRREVAEKLMEKAEEKGWCEEAEEFIEEELGLGEFLDRDVDVHVSFTVTVNTRGRRSPDQDAVDEACRDYIAGRMDSDDWRVVN